MRVLNAKVKCSTKHRKSRRKIVTNNEQMMDSLLYKSHVPHEQLMMDSLRYKSHVPVEEQLWTWYGHADKIEIGSIY